jgi:hypothetical protein
VAIDAQPRQALLDDVRHSREVTDLAGVAPREERQGTALAFGIDDREVAKRRQPPQRGRSCVRPTPRPCGEMTSGIGVPGT